MARRRMFIKTRKGVEVGPHGAVYREDYRPYTASKGKVGKVQLYYRGDDGRFQALPRYGFPQAEEPGAFERGAGAGQAIYGRLPEPSGTFSLKRNFLRDARVLITLGAVIIASLLSFYVLNVVFDYVIELNNWLGTDAPLAAFRTEATWALTAIVGIIVLGGMIVLLFRQDEVDDSIYQGAE